MPELKHPVGIADVIGRCRDLFADLDQWLGLESHYEIRQRCIETDWHHELRSCWPRLIGWLEQASGYEEARIFQGRIDAILNDPLLTSSYPPMSMLGQARPVRDWDEAVGLATLIQKAIGACDAWLLQMDEQGTHSVATTQYVSPVITLPMSALRGFYSADPSITAKKEERNRWMLENLNPHTVTDLELQDQVNAEGKSRGWPLFDSNTGNGAYAAYKAAYAKHHGKPFIRDNRGKKRKQSR